MTTVPENLPTLSAGGHAADEGQACLMEYISLIAGEKWSDKPACTHPVLASAARLTNDRMYDNHRHLLVPLIGRLFGTDEGGTEEERKALNVSLAVFCAKSVRHLVKPENLNVADAAISAAENWLANPTEDAAANAKYAVTTASYSSAEPAADATSPVLGTSDAYSSAEPAVDEAAYSSAKASAATAFTKVGHESCASHAVARAAIAVANYTTTAAERNSALADNLSSLIDEYDRLTGRTQHREVKSEEFDDINRRLASIAAISPPIERVSWI